MPIDTASPSLDERTTTRPTLWFIGALPPPLNGQSNYNRAMLAHLAALGAPVEHRDTGGSGIAKLLRPLIAAIILLVRAAPGDRAYLSVPGQKGVWLFAAIALALRVRGIEHFIHHHSYRPINLAPSRAMRMLVAIGGTLQRHVLLSENMRHRFTALYLDNDERRSMTLSNAYLFGPRVAAPSQRPSRPVTLGHMSVLTREKGVPYLLALIAALDARDRAWRLVIAGSCTDSSLAADIAAAARARPDLVDYRGAVEGAEKERFFADIDLFVLPTTLIDEAEPLVLLEAFARGVDAVASDTGCIRDRIRTPDHLLTLDLASDCALIEDRVAEMAVDWAAARTRCIEHAAEIEALAATNAASFFPALLRPLGVLP